jgi:hypothetical protein
MSTVGRLADAASASTATAPVARTTLPMASDSTCC